MQSEAVKCAPPSRPGHHRRHPSADLAGAALTAAIPTQNLCEVNDSQTTNIANVAKSRTHKINELRTCSRSGTPWHKSNFPRPRHTRWVDRTVPSSVETAFSRQRQICHNDANEAALVEPTQSPGHYGAV